jgi:hypothetical protein
MATLQSMGSMKDGEVDPEERNLRHRILYALSPNIATSYATHRETGPTRFVTIIHYN